MQPYRPDNQPTVPSQPVQPMQPTHPVPQPYPQQGLKPRHSTPYQGKRRKPASAEDLKRRRWLLMAGLATPFVLGGLAVLLFGLVLLFMYGTGDILPGVSAAGVNVGGKSEAEAAVLLSNSWQSEGILLRDGERVWQINPAELGLAIDGTATAAEAHAWGRRDGSLPGAIEALFFGVDIRPSLVVDIPTASAKLEEIRSLLEQPAMNAGVRLVNGQVQAVPPVQGRVLDIDATLAKLATSAAGELADGALDLEMTAVAPAVTDATPLVEQARSLLSSPLSIDVYDPISDKSILWSPTPEEWSQWLVANSDPTSGLVLSLDKNSLTTYLNTRAAELGSSQYLNIDESVEHINAALSQNNVNAWIQVYHHPTTYTVQGGDMISSIGYDLGIPYPWIQAANPGVEAVNPGDTITIPSVDELIPLPVVRNKRIIVSISEQHLWAYENGTLKYDWVISTGIARSPTSPGIFQIRSHDENAYAAQWNLYMPHFMGVYNPGPNAGVMNGFHGFPTDASGGYLLWTNNLGTPATYGCILLSLENAEELYYWAEEGVVVEIRK